MTTGKANSEIRQQH